MNKYIYHIIKPEWWEKFKGKSSYFSETLDVEKFIHCSTEEQILPTCNRHFKSHQALIVLKLAKEKISSKLIYELAPGVGEEFPHIYGPINLDAVVEIKKLEKIVTLETPEGTFKFRGEENQS